MATVSITTADTVEDYGPALEHTGTVEGYTVDFVTIKETMDLAPMLAGLPGGHCSCPHWGYVLKGRIEIRYDDREETAEAGDELAATNAAIQNGLRDRVPA